MPGRAGGDAPKVRHTVIEKKPTRSGTEKVGRAAPSASDMRAAPQLGDAPGEASALHHASARHRARAHYAAA